MSPSAPTWQDTSRTCRAVSWRCTTSGVQREFGPGLIGRDNCLSAEIRRLLVCRQIVRNFLGESYGRFTAWQFLSLIIRMDFNC